MPVLGRREVGGRRAGGVVMGAPQIGDDPPPSDHRQVAHIAGYALAGHKRLQDASSASYLIWAILHIPKSGLERYFCCPS